MLMGDWSGLVATWDWGSIPDWVAAIATPFALLVFVFEVARSRRDRREAELVETERAERGRLAEIEEQVRRVTAWPETVAGHGKYSDIVAHIENSSEMAIFALVVTLRSTSGDILTPEPQRIPVVPPRGRSDEAVWHAVAEDDDAILDVVLEFADVRGRRWRRSGASFSPISDAALSTG